MSCTCKKKSCDICNKKKELGCGCKGKQIDASCIIYNADNNSESKFLNRGYGNGTPVNLLLEDLNLNPNESSNEYGVYDYGCLEESYTITNQQTFAEAIATELCIVNQAIEDLSNYQTSLETLSKNFDSLNYPQLEDTTQIGILKTDSIKVILQKLVDNIGVKLSIGKKFWIRNNASLAANINYYDVNGSLKNIGVAAGTGVEITNVKEILTNPPSTLIITFKG